MAACTTSLRSARSDVDGTTRVLRVFDADELGGVATTMDYAMTRRFLRSTQPGSTSRRSSNLQLPDALRASMMVWVRMPTPSCC